MERQPSDKNPFPEIKLFDWAGFRYRARRVASFLFSHVLWETPSDHPKQVKHPAPYVEIVEGELTWPTIPDIEGRDVLLNRWDDMGNYHDQDREG